MRLKKISIMSVFILFFLTTLTGCSTTTITNDNTNTVSATNQIQELSFLETFISNYNANNTITISNCIDFTAKDKASPYYRTEFRLLDFENAKSIHGNVGNCEIDMIDYSTQLSNTEHTQFRVYLNSNNINEAKEIASIIIKMLDSTITNEEIQKAYNSMSGSFYLSDYIKGTILKNEIMIDYSKTEFKN